MYDFAPCDAQDDVYAIEFIAPSGRGRWEYTIVEDGGTRNKEKSSPLTAGISQKKESRRQSSKMASFFLPGVHFLEGWLLEISLPQKIVPYLLIQGSLSCSNLQPPSLPLSVRSRTNKESSRAGHNNPHCAPYSWHRPPPPPSTQKRVAFHFPDSRTRQTEFSPSILVYYDTPVW